MGNLRFRDIEAAMKRKLRPITAASFPLHFEDCAAYWEQHPQTEYTQNDEWGNGCAAPEGERCPICDSEKYY